MNVENQRIYKIGFLIKKDANALFDKIRLRYPEYIFILSSKRNREHLKDIFFTRFKDVSISDLALFTDDLIDSFSNFYELAEKMKWYLTHTEDMTAAMEDKSAYFIKKLTIEHHLLITKLDSILLTPAIPEDNSTLPEHNEVWVEDEQSEFKVSSEDS